MSDSHEAQHHADPHAQAIGFHAPHVVPASLFLKVLVALFVLTVITVAIGQFDFGSANMFVAMGIAAVKVSLVMTFFMHLKWDTPINQITIISSFMFLSLLFVFTLADYATRGDADPLLMEPTEMAPHPRMAAPEDPSGH